MNIPAGDAGVSLGDRVQSVMTSQFALREGPVDRLVTSLVQRGIGTAAQGSSVFKATADNTVLRSEWMKVDSKDSQNTSKESDATYYRRSSPCTPQLLLLSTLFPFLSKSVAFSKSLKLPSA